MLWFWISDLSMLARVLREGLYTRRSGLMLIAKKKTSSFSSRGFVILIHWSSFLSLVSMLNIICAGTSWSSFKISCVQRNHLQSVLINNSRLGLRLGPKSSLFARRRRIQILTSSESYTLCLSSTCFVLLSRFVHICCDVYFVRGQQYAWYDNRFVLFQLEIYRTMQPRNSWYISARK